ncbi:MAG: VOC family protein, partial [Pseudomonadota bacterium]
MALGPIMQNGYVVRDWREAAAHWATVLGVGPFFALEHVEFAKCRYRGEPTAIDMTVAIAYTGDFQIELVQQHNDAPSIYTDFLARNPPGLQHVGTLVDDLDAALDENGLRSRIVQQGCTTAGARFAYVDTVLHDGTMLELIET